MVMMHSVFSPREYCFRTPPPVFSSMSRNASTIFRMMTMPGDFLRPDS